MFVGRGLRLRGVVGLKAGVDDSTPTGAHAGAVSATEDPGRADELKVHAAEQQLLDSVEATLAATSGSYGLSLAPDPDTERGPRSLEVEGEFAPGGGRADIGLDLVTSLGPLHQLGGSYRVQWIDTFEVVDLGIAAEGSDLLLLHLELFNPQYEESERWVVFDEGFYGTGIGEGHLLMPVDVLDWQMPLELLRGFSTDIESLAESPAGAVAGVVDLRAAAAASDRRPELDSMAGSLESAGVSIDAVPATVSYAEDGTVSLLELRFSEDSVLDLSLADLDGGIVLPAVPTVTVTVSGAFSSEVSSLNALIYGG